MMELEVLGLSQGHRLFSQSEAIVYDSSWLSDVNFTASAFATTAPYIQLVREAKSKRIHFLSCGCFNVVQTSAIYCISCSPDMWR